MAVCPLPKVLAALVLVASTCLGGLHCMVTTRNSPGQGWERTTPWPKPSYFQNGTQVVTVGNLALSGNGNTNDQVTAAFGRLRAAIGNKTLVFGPDHTHGVPATSSLTSVQVQLDSQDLTLNENTNNSYSLEMTTSGQTTSVTILANNAYGAMHALTSLQQLMEQRVDGTVVIRGAPWFIH
ncbi:uncharacterized protein MONBRDRAFT_7742, partial [Monosiga brevicollis MX1]